MWRTLPVRNSSFVLNKNIWGFFSWYVLESLSMIMSLYTDGIIFPVKTCIHKFKPPMSLQWLGRRHRYIVCKYICVDSTRAYFYNFPFGTYMWPYIYLYGYFFFHNWSAYPLPQLWYKDQAVQKQDEPHPAKGQGEAWCLDNEVYVEFYQNENSQEPGLTRGFGVSLANLCTISWLQQQQSHLSEKMDNSWIDPIVLLPSTFYIYVHIGIGKLHIHIWIYLRMYIYFL